jgi:thioredoxin reductase (NADPH)
MGMMREEYFVYTLDGCPWCEKAKELLKDKKKKFVAKNGVNNTEVVEKMKKIGREDYKYWPKIFLNDEFIGGYTDLEKRLNNEK